MKANAITETKTTVTGVQLNLTVREAEILGNLLGNIPPDTFVRIANGNLYMGNESHEIEPVAKEEIHRFGCYGTICSALGYSH